MSTKSNALFVTPDGFLDLVAGMGADTAKIHDPDLGTVYRVWSARPKSLFKLEFPDMSMSNMHVTRKRAVIALDDYIISIRPGWSSDCKVDDLRHLVPSAQYAEVRMVDGSGRAIHGRTLIEP